MAKSFEKALIAPEYTGHPAACLCGPLAVRRCQGTVAPIIDVTLGPTWLCFAIVWECSYLAALEGTGIFRGSRNEFD
ncbi:hypothetical protein [Pseudomonas batumici]|uniref:hypothetical protein n=1 Tax=Pseudomonas batumici TaxID=226910 RepID=UPI001427D6C4|nr:hypothetical protein [Pseudomonas batumici]